MIFFKPQMVFTMMVVPSSKEFSSYSIKPVGKTTNHFCYFENHTKLFCSLIAA